jgi:peptidoglycan-N-acetylglucosamine deacetylase
MLQCAISVDLDEIPNYASIHGVSLDLAGSNAVHDVAVDRLLAWAERQRIPLTLFTVAADLERPSVGERLRFAARSGHEIANHSLNHRYDLTRRPRAEMKREVQEAAERIASAVGQMPSGFRAPGYTTTDELYQVLGECGVKYSSSVFPCAPYFVLKSLAIAWKALTGKRSHSIVDTPRVLTAPTRPYRIGSPYYRRGAGMLEFPMQTTPWLRLPWIGTTLTLAPLVVSKWLTAQLLGEPFLNLELHGIDVLDQADGLQPLAPFQPDVRVPLAQKLLALDGVVAQLRSRGYEFVTLRDAAQNLEI